MSQKEIEKYGKQMLKRSNVTGFSKTLEPRHKDRENRIDRSEMCLQIHVKEKVSLDSLRAQDVIPRSVGNIPVDVVVVGALKIPLPPKKEVKEIKKTDKHRPLIQGISIGNEKITAGTNGMMVTKGEVYEATNAHVVSPDVRLDPNDVVARRILQPGSYDLPLDSDIAEYIAGEYIWHKKLFPFGDVSGCPVGNTVANVANFFAKLAGASTRLIPVVQEVNHIDFGVWKPSVLWSNRFFEDDFNPPIYIGQGFAGSDTVGLVCKAKYVLNEGYEPLNKEVELLVKAGATVHKSGRTSCHNSAMLINESVYEVVNYGSFSVAFDDLYLTGPLLSPGDSGSSVWLLE